mmetsp:Transcript_3239/g.2789  ORF Transcript_3239/g.2789 Transcript_3239/m.2789 type:complete len:159 (-) Transcript_3239:737-1213(-)
MQQAQKGLQHPSPAPKADTNQDNAKEAGRSAGASPINSSTNMETKSTDSIQDDIAGHNAEQKRMMKAAVKKNQGAGNETNSEDGECNDKNEFFLTVASLYNYDWRKMAEILFESTTDQIGIDFVVSSLIGNQTKQEPDDSKKNKRFSTEEDIKMAKLI